MIFQSLKLLINILKYSYLRIKIISWLTYIDYN